MSAAKVTLNGLIGAKNRADNLEGTTPDRVISELLEVLVEAGSIDASAQDSIRRAVVSREREATTGIGNGLAIPHMKDCPHVTELSAAFGRCKAGVDFSATDGEPVHVLFLILTPSGAESEHVQLMKRIVLLSRDRNTMQHLKRADSIDNLQQIFEEIDAEIQ